MKYRIALPLVVLVLVLALDAQALEPFALYDDFNGPPRIDPAKWRGRVDGGGTELIREIQGAELRMANRNYGATTSNSGTSEDSQVRLDFVNPSIITAIKATVSIRSYESDACPANADSTFVRARLFGRFFNSFPPASQDDETSEVIGRILVGRFSSSSDPPGFLRVFAGAFQFLDPAGETSVELVGFLDLGPAPLGRPVTLSIQWDQPNHQFIFRKDTTIINAAYTVGDAFPPTFKSKRLDIALSVANCTTTPRPVGSIDARFDDVFVNSSGSF